MKFKTEVGGIAFTFESMEDLVRKLEVALVKIEQELVEYKKLRKQERLISKVIEQLKNPQQQNSGTRQVRNRTQKAVAHISFLITAVLKRLLRYVYSGRNTVF